MSNLTTMLNRPNAKRKLFIAVLFLSAYILSIAELVQDKESADKVSLAAWGSFLMLTIMAISAIPLVKDFIWPSGLEHTAAQQLSLACHGWKNSYFDIDPDLTNRLNKLEGVDNIWDDILSASKRECTKEEATQFRILFVDEATNTINRIDEIIRRYHDVFPNELRILAQEAITRLNTSRHAHDYSVQGRDVSDIIFYNQFLPIINALSKLDKASQELQDRTKPK